MSGFLSFLSAGVLLVVLAAYALAKIVQGQRVRAWRSDYLASQYDAFPSEFSGDWRGE